jgi:hypothetical protein
MKWQKHNGKRFLTEARDVLVQKLEHEASTERRRVRREVLMRAAELLREMGAKPQSGRMVNKPRAGSWRGDSR